ncbi:MAG: hypothetical protein WC628_10105 [Candidatus Omnitrophota bacterium]
MFRDCDYIKGLDDIIYIVKGDYHPEDKIRAIPVYFPDENGDRTEAITGKKYVRKLNEYSNDLIS